jgi:hypothetical protein
MPSKLDPHIATIENWLAAEPQLTALAILDLDAARIGRPRIVSNDGNSVTFLDAAIRGVNFARRITFDTRLCPVVLL